VLVLSGLDFSGDAAFESSSTSWQEPSAVPSAVSSWGGGVLPSFKKLVEYSLERGVP
jgi:hypothetical protein